MSRKRKQNLNVAGIIQEGERVAEERIQEAERKKRALREGRQKERRGVDRKAEGWRNLFLREISDILNSYVDDKRKLESKIKDAVVRLYLGDPQDVRLNKNYVQILVAEYEDNGYGRFPGLVHEWRPRSPRDHRGLLYTLEITEDDIRSERCPGFQALRTALAEINEQQATKDKGITFEIDVRFGKESREIGRRSREVIRILEHGIKLPWKSRGFACEYSAAIAAGLKYAEVHLVAKRAEQAAE